MTAAALSFDGVRFAFGTEPVLDGIDLVVPQGAVTAVMGPSGCGKSTLLALAAELLEPAAGRILRAARRPAVVFQDPRLLPWRTARDNVAFALKADHYPAAKRRARAETTLAAVGLHGDDARKFPRQLSGGMRQRVALARALAVEPDLLLLDEPFGALDAALARQMHALVRARVDRGATALMVVHDPVEVARIAERVAVLTPGPARVWRLRDLPGRATTRTGAEVAHAAKLLLSDASAAAGGQEGAGAL